MRILVGDIGGTHTRLAVFATGAAGLVREAQRTYASAGAGGLGELARRFLAESGGGCELGTFGVAGPVQGGRSRITNLPWTIDSRALAAELGLVEVFLLNDLEALAHGLAALPEEGLRTLQAGAPGATGNAALIAAGTGLGEAGLFWNGRRHLPWASEGGHADFAPRDEREIELLRWLVARFGRVSWERVLSGPGLVQIYRFLLIRAEAPEPPWLAAAERQADPAAAVAEAAEAGRCEIAGEALDLFASLYGAEAGNLALKAMARGGVYVGGAIAAALPDRLARGPFLASFLAKGRMRPLLEAMPVRLVVAEGVALLGAARYALGAAER